MPWKLHRGKHKKKVTPPHPPPNVYDSLPFVTFNVDPSYLIFTFIPSKKRNKMPSKKRRGRHKRKVILPTPSYVHC